jgi:hypothetical protein
VGISLGARVHVTEQPATQPPPAGEQPPRRAWLQFTFPGCRSELRLGALLVLAGTFLWNFAGPSLAMRLAVIGLPLLVVGAMLQALKESRQGIDAYPWKLAVAMLLLGVPMCWDFRYRDAPGTPVSMLLIGPILASAGAWLLLWWPVSHSTSTRARA